MVNRTGARSLKVLAVAAALCAAALAALAQAKPPAPPPPAAPEVSDLTYSIAETAFNALPEAERRALQDALIWTGDFQSVVTGAYGKRTQAAINAYAKRLNLPATGMLDPAGRSGLAATGSKEKEAFGFRAVSDPDWGGTIALPVKILSKTSGSKGARRYAAPKGDANLEVFELANTATTPLDAIFAQAKAAAQGRTVRYSLLRPDFFVVSGEDNGKTFYSRVAKGKGNLRGYTLSYDNGLKSPFDKISIAIANSFDPFPVAGGVAVAATQPGVPAAPAASAQRAVLETTGLVVAQGQVLAILPASGCNDPSAGKAKARILREDKAAGLALLDAPGIAARPLAAGAASEGAAVVLFFQPSGGQALLAAAAGELTGGAPPRLRAPLLGGKSGGAVFDRAGAVIGLVRGSAAAMPASYEIVPAATAFAFAAPNPKPAAGGSATHTVGEIVAQAGASVVPVFCTR